MNNAAWLITCCFLALATVGNWLHQTCVVVFSGVVIVFVMSYEIEEHLRHIKEELRKRNERC